MYVPTYLLDLLPSLPPSLPGEQPTQLCDLPSEGARRSWSPPSASRLTKSTPEGTGVVVEAATIMLVHDEVFSTGDGEGEGEGEGGPTSGRGLLGDRLRRIKL